VPIENGRFGTVPGGHLGGIGLDLMAAIQTAYEEPHAGRCGVPEGHWRAQIPT
jgi:hypothetical protein